MASLHATATILSPPGAFSRRAVQNRRWGGILDWLAPRACLVCRGRAGRMGGEGDADLCAACHDQLPRSGIQCPVCAVAADQPRACGACLARPPAFASVFAPFPWDEPLAGWVRAYKYAPRPDLGRTLARLLAMEWQCRGLPRPDALAPVPLHPRRTAGRGFSQPAELARLIGRHTGIAVRHDLLRRTVHTPPQVRLSQRARSLNVKGAFQAAPAAAAIRHIALVDDVLTTGSTAHECARTLRKAGAGRVDVWVVARP